MFAPVNQMAVAQAMKQRLHPVEVINHAEVFLDDLSDVPAEEDAPLRFGSRTGIEDLGELLPLLRRKPVLPAARRLGCHAGRPVFVILPGPFVDELAGSAGGRCDLVPRELGPVPAHGGEKHHAV